MNPLEHEAVRRVQAALRMAGTSAPVRVVDGTARSAQDAADALGVELGAIVKSLVFLIGDRPVMALVAGDRRCREPSLAHVLGIEGRVRRADADTVRYATGFAIGGVAPVGLPQPLPMAIDASLQRFATVYAAAGHPRCVFATTVRELQRLTGATVSADIAA